MSWRSVQGVLLVAVLGFGCPPKAPPEVAGDPAGVLAMARAREVDPAMQARFNIKLRSKQLEIAGSTGGGIVLGRPGKGRLDIFPPIGSGALLTVASDGEAIAVWIAKARRHLEASSAELVIRETTNGAAGIDDVLAVLQGDLPFDDAAVRRLVKLPDGTIRLTLMGPEKTRVLADLDPTDGTPRRLEALGKKGEVLLVVGYDGFSDVDGQLLPDQVDLEVPALDLTVQLKYKTWKRLDEPPDVFALAPPEGVEVESLEEVVAGLVGAGVEAAVEEMAPEAATP